MGYGVETFALFQVLANEKIFESIQNVIDLGSQEIHFAKKDILSYQHKEIIRSTINSINGKFISDDELEKLSNRSSTGDFYKYIGKNYKALDADALYGDAFDFNFDSINEDDKNKYCLTVNAGTTEHLINQVNAFKIVHELTREDGFMLHAVPFIGSIDHGFFSYNPNFFHALARFNSYEVLGLWVYPDGMASLLPWNENTYTHLKLSGKSGTSIFCLLKKNYLTDFCIPFQKGYEDCQDESNLIKYNYTVDGTLMTGVEVEKISKNSVQISNLPGRQLIKELLLRLKRRFF